MVWGTGWRGWRNELDITNHIGYMPARNGCGGRSALRFSSPLDGRCSQVPSATPPKDSGSGSDRRPCLGRGSNVPRGLTGRTRVRPVAARCLRAEWTVSCDPRPSFAPMIARSRSFGSSTPAPAAARCFVLSALTRVPRRAITYIQNQRRPGAGRGPTGVSPTSEGCGVGRSVGPRPAPGRRVWVGG